LAGPLGGVIAQVPTVLFAAIVHVPVQHWAFAEQASPGCVQNDEAWHVPLLAHRPEQHWVPPVHVLPTVLHIGLSAVHVPLVHVWPQH
jgi:hypothetical protein